VKKSVLMLLLAAGLLASIPATAQTCNGTPGQWSGCRGNGCAVCWELAQAYPYYFINHPSCTPNTTCQGQYYTCNAACPQPNSSDLQCNGTTGGWQGCRGTGCSVCSELVADYACYFQNHPSCIPNSTCQGLYFTCNANCPAPTEADRCCTATASCANAGGGSVSCTGTSGDCYAIDDCYAYCDGQYHYCASPPHICPI
jgi:hypothetical protein